MRLKQLFLLFLVVIYGNSQAQVVGGKDDKLAKLFSAGKYESCLYKADNLTYKEGSSSDPEPYLYISMCYFELSKSEDPAIQEDYKDSFKQAIKYANKFLKKDKENELYSDNIEYIKVLKEAQFKETKVYFDELDYKRAASSAKMYDKLNREQDFSLLYFVGVCELLSNNSQASRTLDEAKAELKVQIKAVTHKVDPIFKPLIVSGFLKHSEYFVDKKQLKEAYACLDLGMKLMPNEGFLKVQSNMIQKKLNPEVSGQ